MAGLQPQITAGLNRVTSTVSPYNTGRTGASMLRDVYNPVTAALADYETGQNVKAADWAAETPYKQAELTGMYGGEQTLEAKQAEYERSLKPAQSAEQIALEKQIAALQPLIKVGASQSLISQYNDLYGKYLATFSGGSTAPTAAPGQQITAPVDYTGMNPAETLAPQIDELELAFDEIAPSISSWIGQSHIHQQSPAAIAYKTYEKLARKIESAKSGSAVKISQEDMTKFQELSDEFQKIVDSGQPSGARWISSPVFEKYAPGSQAPNTIFGRVYYTPEGQLHMGGQ